MMRQVFSGRWNEPILLSTYCVQNALVAKTEFPILESRTFPSFPKPTSLLKSANAHQCDCGMMCKLRKRSHLTVLQLVVIEHRDRLS